MLICSTLSNEFGQRSIPKDLQSSSQSPSLQKTTFQDGLAISISKEANIPDTTRDFVEHIRTSSKDIEAHRDRVSYFIKSKLEWTGAHDLRKILEKASYFNSTDPRDLIYAFAGLVNSSESICPDYSRGNNICRVLVDAAESLLASEGTLKILDDALIHGRSGECMRLPSWVPDYTSPITAEQVMIRELITGRIREFRASESSQANATVSKVARCRCEANGSGNRNR